MIFVFCLHTGDTQPQASFVYLPTLFMYHSMNHRQLNNIFQSCTFNPINAVFAVAKSNPKLHIDDWLDLIRTSVSESLPGFLEKRRDEFWGTTFKMSAPIRNFDANLGDILQNVRQIDGFLDVVFEFLYRRWGCMVYLPFIGSFIWSRWGFVFLVKKTAYEVETCWIQQSCWNLHYGVCQNSR